MIPYGRQSINSADIAAVIKVLESDYLTQGNTIPAFEKKLTDFTGAKFAVASCNATASLHLACLALGLGEGDWLWTSSISFVASANCGLYCGAKVDFVDINQETANIDVNELEAKLKIAKRNNTLPKVVVVVHMAGNPCDMKQVALLAQQYSFAVIEDASHAIGAKYQNKPIGNCQYSDITIFSFHPVKVITTGEGGAALCNDQSLATKMTMYRSHGITRDQNLMQQGSDKGWYYEQQLLGFNYRMTDIHAALGLSQMDRLTEFVEKRNELAQNYIAKLTHLPLSFCSPLDNVKSSYHLFIIRIDVNKISKSRQLIYDQLREKGIGVNVHYIPIHTQPYYQALGFKMGDFPRAESYYKSAISLPMFPELTSAQQEKVISVVTEILTS